MDTLPDHKDCLEITAQILDIWSVVVSRRSGHQSSCRAFFEAGQGRIYLVRILEPNLSWSSLTKK